MTDQTDTAEAPEGAADPQRETTGAPEAPDPTRDTPEDSDSSEGRSGNKEAARYRRELREAEAELETLRARVESYTRAEIDRVAANHLIDPSDLQVDDISELLDDDGAVDASKVAAAAKALVERKPHFGRPGPKPPVSPRRLQSGASGPNTPAAASWASLIKGQSD